MEKRTSALAATHELLRLWKAAIPIQRARLELAPDDLAEKFRAHSNTSLPQEFGEQFAKLSKENTSGIEMLTKALEASMPAQSAKWETVHALNDYFLTKLRGGEIRCFGFEVPRSINSAPVELRPEHWTAYPDWEHGEFKANGLHLIELRFLHHDAPERSETLPAQRKQGRPGFDDILHAAYRDLDAKGQIVTKPKNASYPAIRAWVRKHYPDTPEAQSKLPDDTIRKSLNRMFEAEQSEPDKL